MSNPPAPFKLTRLPTLKTVADFRAHVASLGLNLPCEDAITAGPTSPLTQPIADVKVNGKHIGNRWAIHPMEGWDATPDGLSTDPLLRRWRHFGISGAKLVWGGEAVAVVAAGRANPRQLVAPALGRDGLRLLLDTVRSAHREAHGTDDDLVVALQLTHSGRFCQPSAGARQPRIAFHHPLLDARHGTPPDPGCVLSDAEVETLVENIHAHAKDPHRVSPFMIPMMT
ncbi:MAG: NADH:flavin oxidoreductase, partial [Verrucomicrobiota bacterium]